MNTNMDNWQMATGMVFFTLVIITGAVAIEALGWDNGIVDHPSGQTIYLKGEGCIVNMTPARGINDMNGEWIWCMEQHLDLLSELKNK